MTLLEWVAALARALLETTDDSPRQRVLDVLQDAPLPLAVFRSAGPTILVASMPWRARFGTRDAPAPEVADALQWADSAQSPITVPAVAIRQQHDVAGSERTCQLVVQPITFRNETRGLLAVCSETSDTDVTHAKIAVLDRLLAALDEAESASRAKDTFLATVSHELRAPITTITLWETVLREHIDDPALRTRALDAIRDSAAAQARLVGDLLDISRAIRGNLRIDRRRVTIESVLVPAVDAALPAANDKGISLKVAVRPRLGRVLADPARLRQVFDNLLSNAIKFTPPGGQIDVEARRDRSSILVSVRDTGCGMEAPFLSQLFSPFARSEPPLTQSEGGLGLGLAIAKQLVELHEGTITATSPGLDRGSTFTVTLPVAQPRARTPVPKQAEPPAARLDGVRVLLVDDDARVREGLTLLLTRVGATVVAASSAADARELLGHERPDVLLCDIAMPVEDGYAFVRALRGTASEARDIPAVALTAYASSSDLQQAAAAGFNGHVAKPVHLHRLVAAIADVLAPRRVRA